MFFTAPQGLLKFKGAGVPTIVTAPSYIAAAESSSLSSSVTVAVPTGTADGDFLLLHYYARSGYSIASGADGWELLNSTQLEDRIFATYYKFASSEPASYTFGSTGDAAKLAIMSAYSNVNTTTPIDASGESVWWWDGSDSGDGHWPQPSIDLLTDNAFTVCAWGFNKTNNKLYPSSTDGDGRLDKVEFSLPYRLHNIQTWNLEGHSVAVVGGLTPSSAGATGIADHPSGTYVSNIAAGHLCALRGLE